MINTDVMLVLLYAHLLSAVAWLGGGILTAFALAPALRSLSPAANLEFTAKALPRLIRFVTMAAVSTLLFGVLLFAYIAQTISAKTPNGMDLYAGIGLAIVAAAVAFAVTIPSFNKVSRIAKEVTTSGSQGPPPPQMMKYGKRARIGSMISLVILLAVLALMLSATV